MAESELILCSRTTHSSSVRQHMKNLIIILGICCFILTSKLFSQVTSNKYEVEVEKGIAKENPEYYAGLKTILWEFQEHLISSGIIRVC